MENSRPYHVFDYTTPWFEWLSYLECCASLGIEPSHGGWLRYNAYFKLYGVKK